MKPRFRLTPHHRLTSNPLFALDIRRAGMYEPWHGPDLDNTRVIREIYPPRMTVTFRHTDADGRVLAEGERKLSDNGFMMGSSPVTNGETAVSHHSSPASPARSAPTTPSTRLAST